jgi:hypothetical protein
MSDVNSSLPIRTQNNGDVAIKVVDGTLTSQVMTVNADGSLNITDNGGSITVDGTVALDSGTLAALENITVSATDLDIRDLAFATDKVDVSGSQVELGATTLAALENITVSATDLDIRDLSHVQDSVKIGDGTDLLAVNADGSINTTIVGSSGTITVDGTVELGATTLAALESITVTATDLDIRDLSHTQDSIKLGDGTDLLAINADGSINVVVSDGTVGTSVIDYNTSASVAAGGTSTHTYTATSTFFLRQIEAAASGKMKIEVQINGATKFVQFNSTANPNMSIQIDNPLQITTGQTITVIRTNKDNQPQDVYSTVVGYTV